MGKTLIEIAQQLSTPKTVQKTVAEKMKVVEETKPVPKVQLIYAFNGTGKTRLSRAFKDWIAPKTDDEDGQQSELAQKKILYYSAFTEDLFYWDNDLDGDAEPKLKIQPNSYTDWLLTLLKDLGQDGNIVRYFQRYTSDKLTPHFSEDFAEVSFSLERGDDEPKLIARLGGDEFVVILEGLSAQAHHAATQAEGVAHKMLQALASPMALAGHAMQSSCSIGVVLFVGDEASADDLMKHADLAMYQAKEAGRNTVRFFDPEMHAAVVHRLALEQDLRTALHEQQLRLYHQPQVDGTGRIIGTEGLVRWQHPLRGLVSPRDFIGLAEDTGLILPLGQWVLETACQQLAQWAHRPECAHLTLSVNVSGKQLRQSDFVAQVLRTLERSGAPAQRLKLELTESVLLDNPQDAVTKMSALQAQGVGFSLDDFGTGYSSLAYLRQLPLDQLKIDQSFVHNLGSDPRAAAIVRTIVTLADNLGLNVIAEGVETQEQREQLALNGCHACQGYLFGRPVPVEELRLGER